MLIGRESTKLTPHCPVFQFENVWGIICENKTVQTDIFFSNLYFSCWLNTEPLHKPALCPVSSWFHMLFVWLFPAVQKRNPPLLCFEIFVALYIAGLCSYTAQCQFQIDWLNMCGQPILPRHAQQDSFHQRLNIKNSHAKCMAKATL